MAKKFIHKKSYTASEVPLPADLKRGELAINLADKKIYSKNGSDAIITLSADADTVDGVQAEAIVHGTNASATTHEATSMDTIEKSGFYSISPSATSNPYGAAWAWSIHMEHKDLNGYGFQMAVNQSTSAPQLQLRIKASDVYGSWVKVITSGVTATQSINSDFEIAKTINTSSIYRAYNSIGGVIVGVDITTGDGFLSQANSSGVYEKNVFRFNRDGASIMYHNNVNRVQTSAIGVTINGGASLLGGINGGLELEGGNHVITTNDGGGNFNIRIGNSFDDGCTEAGYTFHDVYDQSGGTHVFKMSTTSLAVDDTPVWKNLLTLGLNQVTTNTNIVATTASADNIGAIATPYQYGFFDYVSMGHTAATRNADTVFYSSTDTYIRKNTASGFRTSLDVYSKSEAFDSGSNANGTYIKYADGTMVCTRPSISGSSSTDATWTFPAAFDSASVAVTGNMVGSGSGIRSVSFRSPSTTAVDFAIYNSSDARTGDNASLTATGTWS